jgi:GTP:adenosylcobinamide-phosphate guanylyltransferase
MTDQPTILILAGKRDGKLDPLAERAGVSHKCRVPINGKPLLEWVVEAVGPAFAQAKVFISIHDPAVIADLPGVAALQAEGRLVLCEAQAGIVESVEHAIAHWPAGDAAFPLLITTADNVLAESGYLQGVHRDALASEGDAVVVLATRESIRAAHPDGQRKFYEFKRCRHFELQRLLAAQCQRRCAPPKPSAKVRTVCQEPRPHRQGVRHHQPAPLPAGLVDARQGVQGHLAPVRRSGSRRRSRPDGAFAIDVDNERTYGVAELLLKAAQGLILELLPGAPQPHPFGRPAAFVHRKCIDQAEHIPVPDIGLGAPAVARSAPFVHSC